MAWLAALLVLAGCASSPPDAPAGASGPVSVTPQRDWSDAVLYFVILDRFADGSGANNINVDRNNPGGFHGGDLAGLTQQLDEIASLGATAIWITPVARQIDYCPPAQPPTGVTVPGGWFEHCAFHGYWADDYQALDPRFGTEAELKALVDAAHARGIKVLLDVVYNHVGYDARYLTEKPGWFRTKPVDCAVDPLICQVGGLPDFRTELPEVQDYLLDAQLGLAARTGLDGFRLDTVKHVEHEFWQRHRRETRERLGDDFFLLAEVWGGSATVLDEYFAGDEMDAGFDFTFKGSCESYVQGKGRTIAFASFLEKRHRRAADDLPRNSHDLLRRGSGAGWQRVAAQPQRHAVGRARGAAGQGPEAGRGAARLLQEADRGAAPEHGAFARHLPHAVLGRRPAGVRAQRRRGEQRRGRRREPRQGRGSRDGGRPGRVGGWRPRGHHRRCDTRGRWAARGRRAAASGPRVCGTMSAAVGSWRHRNP